VGLCAVQEHRRSPRVPSPGYRFGQYVMTKSAKQRRLTVNREGRSMALRVGLLGAGRIGKVHARALTRIPAAELVAIADVVDTAAADLATETGAQVRTIDQIVDASDIDAVLITTPTDVHADLIERSARAGKAIFCEKPIDLDVERVRACLQVVADTGALLMVGFNRRFDPHFAAARAQIVAGAIGDVEMVQITSRDPGPPPLAYIARSGGLLRDMTIHDFDMARFLLGEEPVSVTAVASVLVDPAIGEAGDVDSAAVILTTATGKIAQIANSRRATYGYDQRIEVHGSLGMVSAGNPPSTTVEVGGAAGFTRPPLMDFFMDRYASAYVAELEQFVRTITTGAPCDPSGDDGLAALVLAEAAVRSLVRGATVNVSEI
jgi:myo-inositol 2-dehydrogenase / D-chiro-inositol 1-dehydrogenase